jgi:predicted phage gp36 major capsid-like protein
MKLPIYDNRTLVGHASSVKITPAFRAKHFTLWVRSLSNASFELKEKSAITGDANDSGYILIDKREQNIARGFA